MAGLCCIPRSWLAYSASPACFSAHTYRIPTPRKQRPLTLRATLSTGKLPPFPLHKQHHQKSETKKGDNTIVTGGKSVYLGLPARSFSRSIIPASEICTKASCLAVNRSNVLQCIPLGFQPSLLRMPSSHPSLARIRSARRAARSSQVSRWLGYANR